MPTKSRLAFVFPGQGSQYVGMGKRLFDQFAAARDVFLEAEDVLRVPIGKLCFEGPEAELKLTEFTQPAILTVSIAALRVLEQERGLRPFCVAGHSLGEYSAVVCAGGLAFRDAVRAVRERGRLMQEAVPPGQGAMAVVLGLNPESLGGICREAARGEVVAPANFNGAGQIVIAGWRPAVERAMALARGRGAKRVLELPVSAPFHCALMRPAAEGLEEVLADVAVRPLAVGVVTNVEARLNQDHGRVKPLLIEQAVSPVRWEESVRELERLGCEATLEIGPGKILCGLIKRISSGLKTESFESPEDLGRMPAS